MAAKRKITINRKKKEEKPVEIVEKPVETVVENEMEKIEIEVEVKAPVEEKTVEKITNEKDADEILGEVWGSIITKPRWRIKFEAQVWAYPMALVPEDIRRYLQSHWFTTEVYKKDKEWLEKHNVNMEMVQKLKDFLTERN